MAWGNRVPQHLACTPTLTVIAAFTWLSYVSNTMGPKSVPVITPRLRRLGFYYDKVKEAEQVNVFPAWVMFFVVTGFKIEAALLHALDFALVVFNFLTFRRSWPSWSTWPDNAVVVAAQTTGMGDLINKVIWAYWIAQKNGIKTVVVDWRKSSYLTDPEVDLFEQLFDVVDAPDAPPGLPKLVPVSQMPPGAKEVFATRLRASYGSFRPDGTFAFAPSLSEILVDPKDFEYEWPEEPQDEMPPPFGSSFYTPYRRGLMRRVLRDEKYLVQRIKLKPKFYAQFAAFRAAHLDGKATVGVHVRAGNGEKGHFLAMKRGKVNIDSVHAAAAEFGKKLAPKYQVRRRASCDARDGSGARRQRPPRAERASASTADAVGGCPPRCRCWSCPTPPRTSRPSRSSRTATSARSSRASSGSRRQGREPSSSRARLCGPADGPSSAHRPRSRARLSLCSLPRGRPLSHTHALCPPVCSPLPRDRAWPRVASSPFCPPPRSPPRDRLSLPRRRRGTTSSPPRPSRHVTAM